jgi:hypothetical protein
MCEANKADIRTAEREFAKALREKNAALERELAKRDAAYALYFTDIEVRKGEVIFGEKR